MQQGFTTFQYMKKWFGEILKTIEQPWTPNWKKDAIFEAQSFTMER